MTALQSAGPSGDDGLHATLLALAAGERVGFERVYDESVAPVLRLALARTRGDVHAAEQLLCRAYVDVRRRAREYPGSGLRALPWVLAVATRA